MNDWTVDKARYGHHPWLLQPSFWAVGVYRFGRWTRTSPRPIRRIAHSAYFVAYSFIRLATGIDIPRSVAIGPGLLIHHFGSIIVHPQSRIGSGCTMRQGVTIGLREDDGSPPIIGDDVVIGAHAQILGNIRIGHGAKIGAMALVLTDVPPGATAVGVPARIIVRS